MHHLKKNIRKSFDLCTINYAVSVCLLILETQQRRKFFKKVHILRNVAILLGGDCSAHFSGVKI